MFEIRFYYKNDDRHLKANINFHVYNSYTSYDEAYQELIALMHIYKEMDVEEIIFSPSIPEKVLEAYVLYLSDKRKDLVTIVNRECITDRKDEV